MSQISREDAWRVLDNIGEWLRFSDTKAAVVISINLALIGWFGFVSVEDEPVARILKLCALVASVVSLGLSMVSITPKLSVKSSRSRIFFGHIAKRRHSRATPEETAEAKKRFEGEFTELMATDGELISEISDQVWANSQVAWRKFSLVGWSLRVLSLALALAILVVIMPVLTSAVRPLVEEAAHRGIR